MRYNLSSISSLKQPLTLLLVHENRSDLHSVVSSLHTRENLPQKAYRYCQKPMSLSVHLSLSNDCHFLFKTYNQIETHGEFVGYTL